MFCFVTVGSTQFEGLANVVISKDVLLVLKSMGYDELCLQCGSGRIPSSFNESIDETGNQCWLSERFGILVCMSFIF